jgi:serine/threonine protein kinase
MEQHLQPGSSFGPYAVEGLIAGGGMGQVYAARHEVYGSVCAIKVLHERLHEDADWRKRFNEEGLVGQQLKHPHVLSARELVEHDGRIAIVMDLVKGGQTLEKVVTREFANGLPLVRALAVFLEIVQGIDYLHGKGIVHGDLKPENVMIEGEYRKPATWHTKLTDFGTVGLIAHPVIIDGRTAVVATPRYASPEHLRGSDNLEVRSDVYCLGLILHFLLTGQHCSDARTVREAAMFVLVETPVVHLVDQPDMIIEVFRKATQVKPKDRYADCRELALAVREALDALGVSLELEDVAADLATEIDEDQAKAQRENLSRSEEPPPERQVSESDAPTDVGEPAPDADVRPGGDAFADPEDDGAAPADEGESVPIAFHKGSESEVTLHEALVDESDEPDAADDTNGPSEDPDTGDSLIGEEHTTPAPSGETTVARPAPIPPNPDATPSTPISAPASGGNAMAVALPIALAMGLILLVGAGLVALFLF